MMTIRWRARVSAVLMGMLLVLLSGCGPRAVEDTYSFGTARVYFADSAAELVLPFELQVRRADRLQAQAPQELTAYNANRHFQTIVEAVPAAADTDVAAAQAYFVQTLADDDKAETTTTVATLDGMPAARVDYTYVQPSNQGPVPLTGRAYITVRNGTLWRIMYQYPTNDPEGAALMAYVDGQIRFREVNR